MWESLICCYWPHIHVWFIGGKNTTFFHITDTFIEKWIDFYDSDGFHCGSTSLFNWFLSLFLFLVSAIFSTFSSRLCACREMISKFLWMPGINITFVIDTSVQNVCFILKTTREFSIVLFPNSQTGKKIHWNRIAIVVTFTKVSKKKNKTESDKKERRKQKWWTEKRIHNIKLGEILIAPTIYKLFISDWKARKKKLSKQTLNSQNIAKTIDKIKRQKHKFVTCQYRCVHVRVCVCVRVSFFESFSLCILVFRAKSAE